MGDKVRGKGSVNGKKAKTQKMDGNRPHELRKREAATNDVPRIVPKGR